METIPDFDVGQANSDVSITFFRRKQDWMLMQVSQIPMKASLSSGENKSPDVDAGQANHHAPPVKTKVL